MDRLSNFLFPLNRRYIDVTIVTVFVLRKIGISLTIRTKTFDIYLLNDHRIVPLESFAHGQNITVLRDIRTTRENHISRGLTYS